MIANLYGLCLVYLTCSISALNTISIKGSKFFDDKTGEQFFIKGVAYQPRNGGSKFEDPLAKPKDCERDAKLMKDLGLNVIRVYEVDPKNNHDECMKTFNDAGIYLMLDLAIPDYSIIRNSPKYNLDILEHYKQNVDAFIKYDNILGFFAGNEVNNDKTNTDANPFVKAVLRDIKAYIKGTSKKKIPVGYANNDDPDTRLNIQKYFNCGPEEERADFFGINIYSWCGKSSFEKSGLKDRTKEFKDYSIPAFFSEYGCNTISPRDFQMVDSLYNDDMSGTFSGGIVYEFSQEDNNYGLVKITKGQASKLKDYENLQNRLKNAKSKGVKKDSYNPSGQSDECPSGENWEASDKLPTTPSKGACDCMTNTLKCGLNKDFNMTKEGKKAGDTFSYLCDNGADCSKFSQDGKKGEYGAWSMCKPSQQLSWALNQVYLKNGENSDSCSSSNNAQVLKPSKKEDECKSIKADVAKDGNGGSGGNSSSSYEATSSTVLALTIFVSLLFYIY